LIVNENLEKKELLVNFAKAFDQDVDESISREVNETSL
jgi:hypothetical protein